MSKITDSSLNGSKEEGDEPCENPIVTSSNRSNDCIYIFRINLADHEPDLVLCLIIKF